MNLGKRLVLFALVAAFVFILIASSVSGEMRECKRDCSATKRIVNSGCVNEAKMCQKECKLNRNECLSNVKQELATCRQSCAANATKILCLRECSRVQREDLKSCSANSCLQECSDTKKECAKIANLGFENCNSYCQYGSENRTCENGNYVGGEIFERGCDKCVCKYDGKVKCEKTKFCNNEDVDISRESCEMNGGLFQGLCAGPYFDVVCTAQNYCLCGGFSNYTCPESYECVTEFNVRVRSDGSVPGWKDLLGRNLGAIGVCAR